jgi:hypothetical protein
MELYSQHSAGGRENQSYCKPDRGKVCVGMYRLNYRLSVKCSEWAKPANELIGRIRKKIAQKIRHLMDYRGYVKKD